MQGLFNSDRQTGKNGSHAQTGRILVIEWFMLQTHSLSDSVDINYVYSQDSHHKRDITRWYIHVCWFSAQVLFVWYVKLLASYLIIFELLDIPQLVPKKLFSKNNKIDSFD